MRAMTAEDKEYRAERDLNSLIDAEKIKADPARLKAVMARKKKLTMALDGMKYPMKKNKKKSEHSYA